ncbi:hypothetical protein EG346_02320 [Chryseobacterium carnipullorum]|uniref:HEXXH motif-containing protein n=1 Tax=Chryseobacterium carnipullorum TaxID=1124835 RepID=A0A376EEL6_CHRCU|nr:hypothetical protein [Chryseobacterium carnipullorum]AZA47101.1 hypothetical protein EG346_02320 [Chryseobacterium carnipullorum]AZA66452.1 hypothetical protein EG345_18450 [Chryseobacterium carnipullorum]STD07884.1 Uncharacterised protein [Chryseobacterium carnipullorum]
MDFYKNFDNCQGNVIDSLKMLLYQRHENIFERIDFEDDRIYLEPLLFAYVMQENNSYLDSIIFGYEKNPKSKIQVFSNHTGTIYIPQIGYLHTQEANKELFLEGKNNMFFIIDHEGKEVSHSFEPIHFLDENIEIVKCQHPLLKKIFFDAQDEIVDVEIEKTYTKHIDHANKAIQLIKEYFPTYFDLIKKTIKKIMIFDGEPNSFANILAHNMIFLNAHNENDEVFFLDHILHESAHVVFNTLTYNSKFNLFNYPFDTKFSEITGDVNEHGDLYSRFHGLFTFIIINACLEIVINEKALQGKQNEEVIGRFSLNMKRFETGINMFTIPNLFTEEGQDWYELFVNTFNQIYERKNSLINSIDVSNQPYVFTFESFKEVNKGFNMQSI